MERGSNIQFLWGQPFGSHNQFERLNLHEFSQGTGSHFVKICRILHQYRSLKCPLPSEVRDCARSDSKENLFSRNKTLLPTFRGPFTDQKVRHVGCFDFHCVRIHYVNCPLHGVQTPRCLHEARASRTAKEFKHGVWLQCTGCFILWLQFCKEAKKIIAGRVTRPSLVWCTCSWTAKQLWDSGGR